MPEPKHAAIIQVDAQILLELLDLRAGRFTISMSPKRFGRQTS